MDNWIKKKNCKANMIDFVFSLIPWYALQRCADNNVDETKLNSISVELVQNVIQKGKKNFLRTEFKNK